MLKEKKSDSQAWFADGTAIRKTTLNSFAFPNPHQTSVVVLRLAHAGEPSRCGLVPKEVTLMCSI